MLSYRELAGEEFWKKEKADYDELMAYRKSIRGKPDEYQKAKLEINKILIDHYNRMIFHTGRSNCDCKGCVEIKHEAKEMFAKTGEITPEMRKRLKSRDIVF